MGKKKKKIGIFSALIGVGISGIHVLLGSFVILILSKPTILKQSLHKPKS
jgi:hypothetical protein